MSLKLCIIVPAHWEAIMGGSQYQAKVLIDRLLADYDVEIVYLTTRADPQFEPSGYRIERFSDRSGIRRYGAFFDAARLYRALRRLAPDAILQYVGCAHTGIAAFYAKRHGCRMIYRVTNDTQVNPETAEWWCVHQHVERRFLEYGIRHADAILAQTRYQASQLRLRYGRDNVAIVPNFHPTPAEAERVSAPLKRVLWIANLKPQKGPEAFVRLAVKFADRDDVRFTMIGRPMDDGEWTRATLATIAAAPNVDYLGAQTQEQVNEALVHADLLVCTSDYEGFANTFIQAWLRRVPVASLHVDPDGLLSRAKLGVVSHTEDRLYADVAELLDSPQRRSEIGARCRAYAAANHSEANVSQIAQLLGAPAAPRRALTQPG
jgi:glycosyltransferase involved in cell wall biosynthesis